MLSNYLRRPYPSRDVNKENWRRRGDGHGRVVRGPSLESRETLVVSTARLTIRGTAVKRR